MGMKLTIVVVSKIQAVAFLMLAASAAAAPAPQQRESFASTLARLDAEAGILPAEKRQWVNEESNANAVVDEKAEATVLPGEKRQAYEVASVANNLIDKILGILKDTVGNDKEKSIYYGPQLELKATRFGQVDNGKKVGPHWLKDQLQPMCAYMFDGGAGEDLVSRSYPGGPRGADWPARKDASDHQDEGDWVEISFSLVKDPNFKPARPEDNTPMTVSLCKQLVDHALRRCVNKESPPRTRGFSASWNTQWLLLAKVYNLPDGKTENAFGDQKWPVKPYSANQNRWDAFWAEDKPKPE